MQSMPTENERLHEVTLKFPVGSKIRRKLNAKISNYARPKEAIVTAVVMTGIHRDVFIKFGSWEYLDPDAYEIV